MQAINDEYGGIIANDVVTMKSNIRASQRIFNFGLLGWKIVAEGEAAMLPAIDAEIMANRQQFEELTATVMKTAPHTAERISQARKDEVAMMAKSVEIFKLNGLEAIRQRQQQEDDKILVAEATRRAEEEAIARERATVSDAIAYGLSRLAAKDLTYRIDNMPEAYRKLQADFNVALEALEPPARKQRAAASGAATTDGWEEF